MASFQTKYESLQQILQIVLGYNNMDKQGNDTAAFTLYRKSKTTVVMEEKRSDVEFRSKSVFRSSELKKPIQYFPTTKKKELLKTYHVRESELSKKSLQKALQAPPKLKKSVVNKKISQKKPKRKSIALQLRNLTLKQMDSERSYLLDDIIVDYMYLNEYKGSIKEEKRSQKLENRYLMTSYLPPLLKSKMNRASAPLVKPYL